MNTASYSEMSYFDGNACAHCAAREEFQRLRRIQRQTREHFARTGRR